MRTVYLFCFFLTLAVAARGAVTNFVPLALTGETFIHDPSTILREASHYYIFGTAPGIRTKSSTDLVDWEEGDPVFPETPSWATKLVPDPSRSIWAPDIIRVRGKYFLYYAVSSFGKKTSAIGLATNRTLNPHARNFSWTDIGPVITATNDDAYNTIDPSAFLDHDDRLWLAFGSYWKGIFLTELNPRTGLRISTNSPLYNLACNHSIEAACLTRHDHFYYLFVNWGQCCQGTNSTYEVRVGRAEKVTGPYRDQDGVDLVNGGGSPFLQSSGRFIGPGHIGIVSDGNSRGPTRFSYHYYDADTEGRSRLAIGKIDWQTGWPVPVN